MKTILVLTDYSDSAKRAALYAINLATQLKVSTVFFYNAYQPPPPIITEYAVIPINSAPFFDSDALHETSRVAMQKFKESLQEFIPTELKVETETEFAILDDYINDVCKRVEADVIVMGVTGVSKIEEVLIGSTALSVIKNTTRPVIVVPKDATGTKIKNVMLACDFKNVIETTPVVPIKNILDATGAVLHIVNIYKSDKEVTGNIVHQQELLKSLFDEYLPQFHFEHDEHFIDGVNHFVESHNIDLIITIPKKRGFFEGLFKERHSKQLAFHCHVPIMYIHDEQL